VTQQITHGKLSTRRARSKELKPARTVDDRHRNHDANGRATKGNALARGRSMKNVFTRATSPDGLEGDALIVQGDVRKLYLGTLKELSSTGALVRQNVYSFATESAWGAYYDRKALQAGLDTDRGLLLAQRASFHRMRAERLSVTVLDEARIGAEQAPTRDSSSERELDERLRRRLAARRRPSAPEDEEEDRPHQDAS
jgi:hypothetical protein